MGMGTAAASRAGEEGDGSQLAAAVWVYYGRMHAPPTVRDGDRDNRANSGAVVPGLRPVPTEPDIAGAGQPGEGAIIGGRVTHYGESYNQKPLGCGTGSYSSDDAGIIAVAPGRYGEWPCGTVLRVCGAAGCIVGTRQDACPGCARNQLDLSEAGIAIVCGSVEVGTCAVTIEVMP